MALLISARVDKSTLANQSFANIYNLINSRSNVVDPKDPTGRRKFVYTKYPSTKSRNDFGYPFIVVSRTRPQSGSGSSDLTKSMVSYKIFITIYTDSEGSNSTGYETGADVIQGISDDVAETLNANKKTFLNYGMGCPEFDSETLEDSDADGETEFITKFEVDFPDVLTTTA